MHLNVRLYQNLKFIRKIGPSFTLCHSNIYLLGMLKSPANVNVPSGSFTYNLLLRRESEY